MSNSNEANELETPQGTLELLILKIVSLQPENGWAIAQRIQQLSSDALTVRQGSLYPALHRLEHRGLIRARDGRSENNRRVRIYELTAKGRRQLRENTENWERLTVAIGQVLAAEAG